MADDRLPTSLWVEACLSPLNAKGIYYYFIQKGNPASGLLLLKLNAMDGRIKLLSQERDFMEDTLKWVNTLSEEVVEETDADAYIKRACYRDPDLWVLEIEDETLINPFDV